MDLDFYAFEAEVETQVSAFQSVFALFSTLSPFIPFRTFKLLSETLLPFNPHTLRGHAHYLSLASPASIPAPLPSGPRER
jgi:hypothetical protein